MTEAIEDYILFLQREKGFAVTIHSNGSALTGITGRLSHLNIHSNPYCVYVKSFPDMWNRCVCRQAKVCGHLRAQGDEIFYGSCYAGVGEYVVPVCEGEALYGFISVSGYAGSSEKALHMADKYQLPRRQTEECFHRYLGAEKPDEGVISTLILPVRAMLLEACRERPPEYYSKEDLLLNAALTYLHRNFASPIGLDDVAAYCHCSRRTLSGLFAAKMHDTVRSYIERLRMEKALALLSDTTLAVTEVAFLCGYSDANYFSARFSRFYGAAPSKYARERGI